MSVHSVGRRVELVSMDPHCDDISISLYVQDRPEGRVAVVHTFSGRPAAAERVTGVGAAMALLAGLEAVERDGAAVRFPCGGWHEAAIRRTFLEACKLAPPDAVVEKGLAVHDKISGQDIEVEPLGAGSYRVRAHGVGEGETSRAGAVARGLGKLGQLDASEDDPTVVSFPCGQSHDTLVGLLLPRALNVRAVLREEESKSSRGVLAAPSANQE